MFNQITKKIKDNSDIIVAVAIPTIMIGFYATLFIVAAKQSAKFAAETEAWAEAANAGLADGTMFAHVTKLGEVLINKTPTTFLN
jgi:hypothetical protein